MDVKELSRLIGAKSGKAEFLPVAFLLKTGYACYGHYNSTVNQGLSDLCVLLNVQLLDLTATMQKSRNTIRDFSDFLEDVVVRASKSDAETTDSDEPRPKSKFGKAIPIAAVATSDIAIVYPVAQIGALLRRSRDQGESLATTLMDFKKSEIRALLLTKLW
jgi:hypothetical protein